MNKKVIAIIIVVIAAILLIRTCSSEKQEIKVTDNKVEPIIQEDVKEPVVENEVEEEMYEEEEELFQPKIEEKPITSAAKIEKIEVSESIKRQSPVQESEEDFFYIVRPGDTLWSIVS